jgi:hypothetical protein
MDMDGLKVPNRTLRVEEETWRAWGERLRHDPQPSWRSRAVAVRALMDWLLTYPAPMDVVLRDLRDLSEIRTTDRVRRRYEQA